MGDEEVGEIRFLTIDGNLTTMTAPIVSYQSNLDKIYLKTQ